MHRKKFLFSSALRDPFAYIGFWQFMTFIMLLLLVWFNELADASALFFNTPIQEPNFLRASIMTVAVLFTAFITIGNTYLQQKRVINNLLFICSNCNKVSVNKETWQRMEDYLREISLLSFTHGLCPDCKTDLMKEINDQSKTRPQNAQNIE